MVRTIWSRRRHPRRGIAPLEFVLSLPPMVFVAAMIFALAIGGLAKTEVAIRARHDAWTKRYPGNQTTQPLRALSTAIGAGTVDQRASRSRHVPPVLFTRTATGQSYNAVLSEVWDYRVVPRQGAGFLQPHRELLEDLAADGVIGQFQALQQLAAGLSNLLSVSDPPSADHFAKWSRLGFLLTWIDRPVEDASIAQLPTVE